MSCHVIYLFDEFPILFGNDKYGRMSIISLAPASGGVGPRKYGRLISVHKELVQIMHNIRQGSRGMGGCGAYSGGGSSRLHSGVCSLSYLSSVASSGCT